jgi:hypothetical protein
MLIQNSRADCLNGWTGQARKRMTMFVHLVAAAKHLFSPCLTLSFCNIQARNGNAATMTEQGAVWTAT